MIEKQAAKCPLVAISGHYGVWVLRSVLTPKADIVGCGAKGCLRALLRAHEQEVAAVVAGEELPTSPKPYSTDGSRRD